MDNNIFKRIFSEMPKHNTDVTHGYAYHQMKMCEEYIVRLIRCAETRFPPEIRFSHMSRCSPAQEVSSVLAKRGQKQYVDLSQSDVYLVNLHFTFNGKSLKPKPLYLPYVSEAGIITISGNKFAISPVLADVAISAGDDNIYVPLNLDKLIFKRVMHHFRENGKRVSSGVVYSEVYHNAKKPGTVKTINAVSTMAHYMFAKYGVIRTFVEFAGAVPVIGYSDTVNTVNYPEDKWVICESMRINQTGLRVKYYQGEDIRLAFRKEEYSTTVISLVAGFFYVADRFPDVFKLEDVDNTVLWCVLLGHIVFATEESEGKLLNKIYAHLTSLDGYIDGMSQEWLAEDGVHVETVYDLFMEAINTFPERTLNAVNTASTMYGKRLMVLRYVLIDIIKSIFKMMFALQNASKKNMTEKDVDKIFKILNTYQIFRINHRHGEVASISSPSACMSFKTTAGIIPQTNITTGKTTKSSIITSANKLDASIAEIGQYNNMPKGEPTGRRRVNPYVLLDERGIAIQRKETADIINSAQNEIRTN